TSAASAVEHLRETFGHNDVVVDARASLVSQRVDCHDVSFRRRDPRTAEVGRPLVRVSCCHRHILWQRDHTRLTVVRQRATMTAMTTGSNAAARVGAYRPGLLTLGPDWVSSPPMSGGIRIVFNGVRGSTPCAGSAYERYGG